MTQCNICSLSFVDDEGLKNHKKEAHVATDKVPTLAQTSAQQIREQHIAHEKGEDASFGFGVGDPVAASGGKKVEDKDETKPTVKKFGEK